MASPPLTAAQFLKRLSDPERLLLARRTPIVQPVMLADTYDPDNRTITVQAIKFGTYEYWTGPFTIDQDWMTSVLANHRAGVVGYRLTADFDHSDSVRDTAGFIPNVSGLAQQGDSLMVTITNLTDEADRMLRAGQIQNVSLTFYRDFERVDEPGKSYGPTVFGIAFTNRPHIPGINAGGLVYNSVARYAPELLAHLSTEGPSMDPITKEQLSGITADQIKVALAAQPTLLSALAPQITLEHLAEDHPIRVKLSTAESTVATLTADKAKVDADLVALTDAKTALEADKITLTSERDTLKAENEENKGRVKHLTEVLTLGKKYNGDGGGAGKGNTGEGGGTGGEETPKNAAVEKVLKLGLVTEEELAAVRGK